MNVILILLDSLNRHHLPCYGNTWVQAPNIQRLADRGVIFDRHYISSAPCMPARREIFSGRREFLHRGWGVVEPFDRHLAAEANRTGAKTALVTDHYHYWDAMDGFGYPQPFNTYEMIRGQETDNPIRPPAKIEDAPDWVRAVARFRGEGAALRHYRNVAAYRSPDEFPVAQVFQKASEWLSTHCGEKFFLMVESFDPHEPWYVPEPYRTLYGPYDPGVTCWPPYQRAKESREFFAGAGPSELAHIERQYAAKVTMADHYLGRLLDTMDRLDLWKETVVILTTDHGHELGERGRYGKSYPHWETQARIPMIVWDPRHPGNGARARTLSCTVDVYSTVLDALGHPENPAPHGRSVLPAVADPSHRVRDGVLYGTFFQGACLATEEYTYFSGYDNDAHPVYWYSTRLPKRLVRARLEEATSGPYMDDVPMPVWRVPIDWYLVDSPRQSPPMLYRIDGDPAQERNVIESDPEGLRTCRDQMRSLLEEGRAPKEQFARLGLEGGNT